MKLDRVIAVRNSKTVYRDGDKCIKVFNRPGYSPSQVLGEALNQSCVGEAGLCVPEICGVTQIEGKWAIVSRYIRGKTLDQLIKANRPARKELTELFVGLQMQMHSLHCPMPFSLRDKLDAKISSSALSACIRYGLRERLKAMPEHSKLCHGDFDPSNIIISDDGMPYIIDWAHAASGNASADAARTYLLLWLSGDIDGAQRYLDIFCEKSGTPMEYVREWMPIVAAAESTRGNEKQRELLLSWVEEINQKRNKNN